VGGLVKSLDSHSIPLTQDCIPQGLDSDACCYFKGQPSSKNALENFPIRQFGNQNFRHGQCCLKYENVHVSFNVYQQFRVCQLRLGHRLGVWLSGRT
jgi:hypothetical protein